MISPNIHLTATGTAGVTSAGAPVRIGTVALTVRDLDTMGRFYEEVVGLAPIDAGSGLARLGVGDTTLLELRHDPAAPLARRVDAGLFHTAFLLPSRAHLAQWLIHALDLSVPLQGASDHLVSEAIYLADPEGNGIEIYWDRPSETWTWRDGMVEMATHRLDVDGLVGTVATRSWAGLPACSIIGHVHLQVGDLRRAEAFYAGVLGLDVACRYPGATFLSSGGYHHHIGTNVWNSRGASPRPSTSTGLANVELVAEADWIEGVRARLPGDEAALGYQRSLNVRDPWGTALTLVPR